MSNIYRNTPKVYQNSGVLFVETLVPMMAGSLDTTGLLGVTITDEDDNVLTPTLLEIKIDYPNRLYFHVNETLRPNTDYFFAYDSTVGDLREVASYNETERSPAPNFGTACGVDWDCVAGSGSVDSSTGDMVGAGYMYHYMPQLDYVNRHYHIQLEAGSGSGVVNGFEFDFGETSRLELKASLEAGESLDFTHSTVKSVRDTRDTYIWLHNPIPYDAGAHSRVVKCSIKEIIPVQGDKIPSMSAIPLRNYINTNDAAHLMHFKFDETSGADFVCSISGATINEFESNVTFGASGVEFGDASNLPEYANNPLGVYGAGIMIFYFSIDWLPNGSGKTNKAGLSHISVNSSSPCDIQRADGGGSGTLVSITGDFQRRSATETLSGADDPWNFTDSKFAGCVVIRFNKDGTAEPANANKIYLSDGTTMRTVDLATNRVITNYDLSDTCFKWFESAETLPFTPAERLSRPHVKGIYNFKEFDPTSGEIETFLAWMFTQSRAGNKETYPAWRTKR